MVYARQSSHHGRRGAAHSGTGHIRAHTSPGLPGAYTAASAAGFASSFGAFPITISDADADYWRSTLGLMSGNTAAHAPEETSFTAPEGAYSLTDDVKPPVLHSQIVNSPNLYPSRLTTITVAFPGKQASQGFAALLRRDKEKQQDKQVEADREKEREQPLATNSGTPGDKETDESVSGDEAGDSDAEVGGTGSDTPQPPTPGLFSPTSSGPFSASALGNNGGKKKPSTRTTHNIRSTSSSFVTRIHTAEGLTKHLAAKAGDVTFTFYNGAKSFFWYEVGGSSKEPLARVTFAAFPTCHDINRHTSSFEALDLLIGFNTGDIMWFDPLSSRYVRINKGGCMTTSPVTCVRWVPGHKSMFLASHADGTINVYDKEREDGNFSVASTAGAEPDAGWNALEEMIVVKPPAPQPTGKEGKSGMAKNPVSHWRLCRRAITDFSFSPDMRHLASTSEDGCLRIIDPSAERLLETYSSYFGSLTSCAWTPDSRCVLTGGQDDLVSIFSLRERGLLARCQGHSSFVVAVSVDAVKSDGRNYRFGSVGEDKQLVLWDYVAPTVARQRTQTLRGEPGKEEKANSRYHPAPPRALIPVIYPSMIVSLQGEILSSLAFVPQFVLTVTRPGWLKSWQRPTERAVDMRAEKEALFARKEEVVA